MRFTRCKLYQSSFIPLWSRASLNLLTRKTRLDDLPSFPNCFTMYLLDILSRRNGDKKKDSSRGAELRFRPIL